MAVRVQVPLAVLNKKKGARHENVERLLFGCVSVQKVLRCQVAVEDSS